VAVTDWLIRKSALACLGSSPDAEEWASRIGRGLVRIPDLLIAATAELTGLTVLHLDKDFELISELTGQNCERLRVSPGRVPSDQDRGRLDRLGESRPGHTGNVGSRHERARHD
jgi:hypothetical protein